MGCHFVSTWDCPYRTRAPSAVGELILLMCTGTCRLGGAPPMSSWPSPTCNRLYTRAAGPWVQRKPRPGTAPGCPRPWGGTEELEAPSEWSGRDPVAGRTRASRFLLSPRGKGTGPSDGTRGAGTGLRTPHLAASPPRWVCPDTSQDRPGPAWESESRQRAAETCRKRLSASLGGAVLLCTLGWGGASRRSLGSAAGQRPAPGSFLPDEPQRASQVQSTESSERLSPEGPSLVF